MFSSKQFLLTLSCIFSILQVHAQTEFDPDVSIQELSGKKSNIGLAAAYSVNGNIQWSGEAGFSCLDENQSFTTSTLTRIASISKNITAVALMQLVEKDKIDLDAPIQTYLPEFPEKTKGTITTRQLLAHTAGIGQYQNKSEVENSDHFASLQEAMEVFADRPLLFTPGSKFFYTSYGYVILGRIIEEVSGTDFGSYVQTNIFDVAGMNNTGIENAKKQYENKSCLYHQGKRKEATQNDLSNRIPGGGFYSTVEDILKFGNALLEEKFIAAATLEQMLISQDVEYDGNKYGLGWYFYGPPPYDNLVIGHSGGQTGCSSQLMIIPKSKTVVVVLSNTSGTYPQIAGFASNLIGHSEKAQ